MESHGVDCERLPGVARRGGVSCRLAECRIHACRKGWQLEDGMCVPNLGKAAEVGMNVAAKHSTSRRFRHFSHL